MSNLKSTIEKFENIVKALKILTKYKSYKDNDVLSQQQIKGKFRFTRKLDVYSIRDFGFKFNDDMSEDWLNLSATGPVKIVTIKLDPSKFVFGQITVSEEGIIKNIYDTNKELPNIEEVQGYYFVNDGTHRIVSQFLLGKKEITAKVKFFQPIKRTITRKKVTASSKFVDFIKSNK